MSTPDPHQSAPWEPTEAIPDATETTRPLPPQGVPRPPRHPAAARHVSADDHSGTAGGPTAGGSSPVTATETTRPLPGPRQATSGENPTEVSAADSVNPAGRGPEGMATVAPRGSDRNPEPVREWGAFSPKTMLFGALDLVVDALLNFFWVTMIATLIITGIVMIPAAGLGILVLIGTVYVIWAAVWLERRRSASSFGLDLRDPQRRLSPRTDWVRVLHQVWLDTTDGSVWLGLLHMVLTFALGVLSTLALVTIGAGVVGALAPLFAPADSLALRLFFPAQDLPDWFPVVASALAIVVGLVLLALLTLAHRGLSASLLRMSEAAALRREAEESRRQVEYVTEARESAVRGAHTERSRIERDLHDGVQPQLVSVAMNLSMAKSRIDSDPEAAKELVAEAHGTTKAAITELRRLARGFHPAVLEDRGLDAAISAVAAQAPFPVDVNVQVARLKPETEAAVYFAVSESLTNAVKHSGARAAEVAVSIQDGDVPGTSTVVAGIRDQGRGGARVLPGGGLSGIEDRIRSAGGRFFLDSPAGGPTEVIVQLPLGAAGRHSDDAAAGSHPAHRMTSERGA